MFSIDHAQFITNLTAFWAFLNYGNYAYWVITMLCGYGIYKIVGSFFDDDTPEEPSTID